MSVSRIATVVALGTLALALTTSGCSSSPPQNVRVSGEVRRPSASTVDVFPGIYFAPSRAQLKVAGIDTLEPVSGAHVQVDGYAISTGQDQTGSRGVFNITVDCYRKMDKITVAVRAPSGVNDWSGVVQAGDANFQPAAGTPLGPDGPWFLIVLDTAKK